MTVGMRYFVLAFFITLVLVVVIAIASGFIDVSRNVSVSAGQRNVNAQPVFGSAEEIPRSDVVYIRSVSQFKDKLVLEVSYYGCSDHSFSLYVSNPVNETNPTEITAQVVHDQHGDTCNNASQSVIDYSLSSIKQRFGDSFVLSVLDSEGTPTQVDIQ